MTAKITSQIHKERMILQDNIPLKTPLVIYTEPSGFCNFKCTFCPHGIEPQSMKKDLMTVALYKKMIDDMRQFENPVKLLRICGTGEPLLNKNILTIVEHSAPQPYERSEFVTNGVLLNSLLVQYLPRYVDRIIISIEGLSSEDYRQVCKADIDFDQLVNRIWKLYTNRGKCKIHIKIIEDSVKTEDRKRLFFDIFGNYCDEIYIEKLVPLWYGVGLENYNGEFRWGGQPIKHRVCAQMFKGMQIQADGVVVPCCVDWKRGNVLGDMNYESLYDIWNGEKLRKLQARHLAGEKSLINPCKDCQMNDYGEIDNIDCLIKETK